MLRPGGKRRVRLHRRLYRQPPGYIHVYYNIYVIFRFYYMYCTHVIVYIFCRKRRAPGCICVYYNIYIIFRLYYMHYTYFVENGGFQVVYVCIIIYILYLDYIIYIIHIL